MPPRSASLSKRGAWPRDRWLCGVLCRLAGSGIKKLMMQGKLGHSVERWFTQIPNRLVAGHIRYRSFTDYTGWRFRAHDLRFPVPEFTPVSEAPRVARWLADCVSRGLSLHLDTMAGCAVRVCMAASKENLDISGTYFRVGSEPMSEAKARVIYDAGCRVAVQYAMAELGPVATGCADGVAVDDMHLLEDKVAILQRPGSLQSFGAGDALYLTTVLDSCPKLMINVESGDCCRVETRACGCLLGQVGYSRHLHHLRSYQKLTTDGVTFLATDLHHLLETVLPARFGGQPTDYQFVEEEDGGPTRVTLLVSPRVGVFDEEKLRRFVLKALADQDLGYRHMSGVWRDAGAVRVERKEPLVTGPGKILPLHSVRTR